jgi:enoyl-CoA hydratase
MEFQSIKVEEREGGIGIITLNRPEKRNAISIQMRREISYCLNEWKHSSIHVVILTGAGSAFSAGVDLDEFRQPELFDELLDSSPNITETSGFIQNPPSLL